MVVDCVLWVFFLEDWYEEELEQISRWIKVVCLEVSLQGMFSLGEIFFYGEGYLEFFNKIIVIGLFY